LTQALLSGAAIGALYVLMSIGFALNLEIADIVNAAHGAFVVGGMYVTLELVKTGVPVYIAVVLATLAGALVSYPMYVLLIRPAMAERGHRTQLVFTLLILSALTVVYQLLFSADIQTLGVHFRSVSVFGGVLTTAQLIAIVLAVVVSVGLYVVARFTMIGKLAYVASRYPLGARSVGVPVNRIYASVFVLAGALAGLGGGILMTFQPVEPTLGLRLVIIVFLVALVARTNLLGCLVLGLLYGMVQAGLSYSIDASTAATLTLVVFLVALVGEPALRRSVAGLRNLTARRGLATGVAR
jgi:branched-chain amino acid transport system permease protein